MAAIAWSYAAAMAIGLGLGLGLGPAVIFHNAGYKGSGAVYADAFASGGYFGVPLLH